MKKIFCRIAIAFAMITLLLSSCSEKEATYTFYCRFFGNLQDETAAEMLVDYLNGSCGGYFAAEHSYTGLSAEATQMAISEFRTNCLALDEDRITHYYLAPGENVVIYLLEKSSGTYVDYCGWVNTDAVVPEDDTH